MSDLTREKQLQSLAKRLETLLNDVEDCGCQLGWSIGEYSIVDRERKVPSRLVTWDPDTATWELG